MRGAGKAPPAPGRTGTVVVFAAVTALLPWGLGAQEPGLGAVDSLAARGDVERARELLGSWWDDRWRGASRQDRQRALWLRGRLTVDPALARRDYARLTVEFPGGPYSADALHRLGLEAAAAGRWARAASHFEELLSRYPSSPLRLEARSWLERHRDRIAEAGPRGGEEGPGDVRAPRPPGDTSVEARVGEPGEGAASEEEAEPGSVLPPGEEAAPGAEDPTGDPAPRPGADAARPVALQLGAFSTEERARTFAREVEAAGYEVRVVRIDASGLFRVRMGRFRDEEEARAMRARVREDGYPAMVVSDAHREAPVS